MHEGGDICIIFRLQNNESGKDGLCESVLLVLERALDDFIESLKEDYDEKLSRMIFVSVHSEAFLNGALYMSK